MPSPNYSCEYLIISCIDFRIQSLVSTWFHKKFFDNSYDFAAFAGGVKNLSFAIEQVEISERLHHITQLMLIAHQDCGAYGRIARVKELQIEDLRKAKKEIMKLYPNLDIHLFYLHVSGVFEEIE